MNQAIGLDHEHRPALPVRTAAAVRLDGDQPPSAGGGTSAQPATTTARNSSRITCVIVRDDGHSRREVPIFEHQGRADAS
jgi:hypothetical protein